MLRWLVLCLAAIATTTTTTSGYSVDVNNPPRRNNDIETAAAAPGLYNAKQFSITRRLEDVIAAHIQKRHDSQLPAAFIGKYGYPVEEYKVTTEDGYILTLYRIPHGVKNATNTNERKEPVFIQHGLMSSAMDFLITGPDRALGFVLADAGYDVWLGNTRGSTYSRAHRDLSPDAKQYWQFTWHEIGERDLPAMINFVLRQTGYRKLHYVGHSQGTTAYFVMCNQQPRMQEKIQTMNALAPIAYMSNLYSPLVRFIAPFSDTIAKMYNYSSTNTGEVMAHSELMKVAGYELCKRESAYNQLCANMIYLAGGWGSDQLDPDQISDILSYSPASSSIFQLAHYGQEVVSGDFGGFDFGVRTNLNRYAKPSPPKYDTSKITSRVALHYSDNDWLAAVVDVDKLSNRLQNMVGKYRVPESRFNHMDFCWGKDAKRYVYDRVIGVMRRFPMQSQDFRGGSYGGQNVVGLGLKNTRYPVDKQQDGGGGNNQESSSSESNEEIYGENGRKTAGWGLDF